MDILFNMETEQPKQAEAENTTPEKKAKGKKDKGKATPVPPPQTKAGTEQLYIYISHIIHTLLRLCALLTPPQSQLL